MIAKLIATVMPKLESGRITRVKTCQREQPRSRAASIVERWILESVT